eukprot:692024-Pyramimonas_sp.AAC.1
MRRASEDFHCEGGQRPEGRMGSGIFLGAHEAIQESIIRGNRGGAIISHEHGRDGCEEKRWDLEGVAN